jgi:DNA primase
VLCFDGDGAGVRAAFRAVDLALPRLAPGKSLKFGLLPQGQDPDDLVRSGGRDAVAEVIEAARSLAAMLWSRETEGHAFDTPERRAALEARIHAVTAAIADDAVRKYYRQDFSERLGQLFGPPPARRSSRRPDWNNGPWRSGTAGLGLRTSAGRPGRYVVMSQQLASSPVHRSHGGAIPRGEALILLAALNHPWLLHDHLEELSALGFRHPDAERLKGALIDLAAQAAAEEAEIVRTELAGRGFGAVVERVSAAITTGSVWGARPEAAPEDVLVTWGQLIALHRRCHSLIKELKDAELALGRDNTESNYLRLCDVKERLSRVEGTEAQIDGFGASSGRGAGAF